MDTVISLLTVVGVIAGALLAVALLVAAIIWAAIKISD